MAKKLKELKDLNCKRRDCRKPFKQNKTFQRFCSDACRDTVSNRKRAKRFKTYKKIAEQAAGVGQ